MWIYFLVGALVALLGISLGVFFIMAYYIDKWEEENRKEEKRKNGRE